MSELASLSSSSLTTLNVSTLTFFAKRAGRYISHTQVSLMVTSKNLTGSVRASPHEAEGHPQVLTIAPLRTARPPGRG